MSTRLTRADSGYRDRPVVAALAILYSIELVAIVDAAMLVGKLVAAAALVGWQAIPLLRGQRVLSVAGLAMQSAILIASIAIATQRPTLGVAGVVVAGGILAGWGRLGRPGIAYSTPAAPPEAARTADGEAHRAGLSGIVVVLLTSALVLGALSVRGGIVVAMVVLAIIFIPLERLFALHPRQILRPGWRTDVVHYLINGAALKVGIV